MRHDRESRRGGWVLDTLTPRLDHADSLTRTDRWVGSDAKVDEHSALWQNYLVLVDLYKYYLDIAWKSITWYYLITGVVLAFFFNNVGDRSIGPLPLILVFLALVSFGFSFLYFRAARGLHDLKSMFEHSAFQLQLPGRPHVEFAGYFLLLTGSMCFIVGVGCLVLFIFYIPDVALR